MTMTTRVDCASCGTSLGDPFLNLGRTPIAGDFRTKPNSVEPVETYPLRVAACGNTGCGLVQLVDVIDNSVLYGRDYPYYSGASRPVVDHMDAYARYVHCNFPRLLREHGLVEIASNDGTFLQHFTREMVRYALGVEPASGPASNARMRGFNVLEVPFDQAAADAIVEEHGQPGVVVANNVLAHVYDLHDFLGGVRRLLHPDGIFLFEVQYLPDLVTGNAFDLVYHEHHYFWSVTALHHALQMHGLVIMHVAQHGMQGGSIRVEARHAGPLSHADFTPGRLMRAEKWLPTGLPGMQGRVDRVVRRLSDLLDAEDHAGRVLAGYAASAKGTTLLAQLDVRRQKMLRYAVDTTEVKWGRYMPGTDIPIVPPVFPHDGDVAGIPLPDTYLLLVGNYLGPVMRYERNFLNRGGRIITPLPVPTVI
jgi:novobiocin biosynthesis protein NovU/D-mycarose 3-C-methyltransferase